MRQSIRRLVVFIKMIFIKSLWCEYLCHLIIKYFVSVIQKHYNKFYGLAYKVDLKKT